MGFFNFGIVVFKVLLGNLKRFLDYYGIMCEWNWGLSSCFYIDKFEFLGYY